jgi:S-adenosylmethionine-dependent methyltransferase
VVTDIGRGGGVRPQGASAQGARSQGPRSQGLGSQGLGSQGLWDALLGDTMLDVVAARVSGTGRAALDVVDVGGGTGGLAVPLATLGHNVTVVDPSPDALAAAQRRAAEVSVPLSVVQGEAASVADLLGPATADLVICHNVLEYVDSPAGAMAGIAQVLRSSGVVSVLAANAVAAVLHHALAGRFAEARRLLANEGTDRLGSNEGTDRLGSNGGTGRAAAAGQELQRRFTLPELTALVEGAGLRPGEARGLRIFGGLVPGSLADTDTSATGLLALERAAAAYPPLRDIAAQLHLLGHR